MGLPLSISTSYVPNSTPPIKAQDLNDLQQYLAGLYTGGYTVKSLDVDGTGGAAGGAPDGTIRLRTPFTGTTAPTTALPAGALCKAAVPLGWAYVYSSGTLVRGYNVLSTSRVSRGYYEVIFNASPADPDTSCAIASVFYNFGSPNPAMTAVLPFGSSGKQAVRVSVTDRAGLYLDSSVYVVVWGE